MGVNPDFIPENASVEEKLDVIADEVLDILKQLSKDNSKQLSSKSIAECLILRDSVKKIIESPEAHHGDKDESANAGKQGDINLLREITETIMNRFSELAPSFLGSQFAYLNDQYLDKTILDEASKWLNSSFKIVKKYFESVTSRIKELEQFIVDTMRHLHETEEHVISEVNSIQETYNENNEFAQNLSMNMERISQDFDEVKDLKTLKKEVMGTIGNINKCIDEKSELDMQRLKEKEKKLKSLGRRINDITKEADEIKKKAEKLEQESLLDKLTGVNNRKAYDNRVTETIAGLKRYKVPSSLMLCDIDYFKKINDAYGHKVGDLALKKFAALLNEKLRATDFVARYGGEEFAVILPHIPLDKAKAAGESVRAYINQSVFSYKENEILLTVSIGVSTFRKNDTASSVFDRADRALYLAKHSGRNVVKTEEDVLQESDTYIMTARK
jgi:diguanylate cyclase (GGDEF)-like protein